jgi:hypothetical protein
MKNEVVSVNVPMTFKKRSGRKVIVLPDGTQGNPAPKATVDNTMVKAIARAFRWQALLENGTYGCLDEIAKAERIGPSFISRIIRIALLAPDIVDAILDGRQPAHLTLKHLMTAFPVEWERQKLLLMRPHSSNIQLGFQGEESVHD